jgi:hypothetical protein
MPTQVQFRRGNTTATSTFTGANGEISINTDTKALVIHDGVTAGGFPVLTADNPTLTGNTSANNVLITGKFFAGNTTANLTANSTLLNISNATSAANLSPSSLVIGSAVVNSTVLTIATGNFSTGANVGANVNLTTSTIQVGNSSVNTQVNSSSITTTTFTGSEINIGSSGLIANSTAIVIAEPVTANGTTGTAGQVLTSNGSTGAPYWIDNQATTPATYVQNTDSRTLSGNLVISGTYFNPSANTVLLGNATSRWVVSANSGDFTGTVTGTVANMSTSVNSALLTVGSSFIANTTGAYHTGVVNAASLTTSGFVANATGIIPTSNTISLGSATGRFVLNANSGNFTANIAMNSNYITGLSDPSNAQDAATKAYVDTFQQGLHVHASVAAATTGTLATLSGGTVTYDNGTSGVGATLTLSVALTTLDGYTLVNGDRIMVKDQANTAHNGIYTRTSSTVLTRATDYDSAVEIAGGDFSYVTNGTLYNSTGWVQIDEVTTVGTDAVVFQQFSGQGTFTAGNYLYLTGSQFNANADSASTASVLIARDASKNFAANTATLNSVSATTGTFSGAVSGITTLGAGNTSITGFANASISVNSALLTVGTSFIANTTGVYHTGLINAASINIGSSSFIANSSAVVIADPLTANGGTGTAGQVLASNGSTGSPYWVTAGGGSSAADDTTTNGTRYVLFANQTTGTISTAYVSSTKLTYNPSTGTLTSTVVTASSDEKLKTNIHTISDPIDVISNLRGVSFDRKDTGLKDFGVIAQEIEQVIPEVVHIDNDGFRSVSYNSIIGFLIEGMKQQQSKISDLEEKIQKLLD